MINVGDKFKVTQEYIDWCKTNYQLSLPTVKAGDILTVTLVGDVYHGCDVKGVGYRILSADSFSQLERINE